MQDFNLLFEPNVYRKLQFFDETLRLITNKIDLKVPVKACRDIQVLPTRLHPDKKGLSFKEGQARLLHDLASIELQAMELALRTLIEFPQAPKVFREELIQIAISEKNHLALCLEAISSSGFKWGDWPIHNLLWDTVSVDNDLLDRILIVHLYLEGSGLDASHYLVQRLHGVAKTENKIHEVIRIIAQEELDHVRFGTYWFSQICRDKNLDAELEYEVRFAKIKSVLPRRVERINHEIRAQVGFSDKQIKILNDFRDEILK